MSERDNSTEDESFLARWAQRKHEAKQPVREVLADEPQPLSTPTAENNAEQEIDLASLPKLEDVTETTDITAFLRKGVPENLRNAALRKSWALDPAIRNYVNPALDYAYDWNAVGGVPGSGEIAAGTDIAKMVLQIMGGGESTTEAAPPTTQIANESADQSEAVPVPQQVLDNTAALEPVRLSGAEPVPRKSLDKDDVPGVEADQMTTSEQNDPAAPQHVRRHGTAKPHY